jgi:hypothetical protein
MMDGLTSRASPVARREQAILVYSAEWLPAFLGEQILSGEYDDSGTVELGGAADEAIVASTFMAMSGTGHLPMSESPGTFVGHLLLVPDRFGGGPDTR